MAKSGSKAELNQRIANFLRTGKKLVPKKKPTKIARTEELTLESLIEENIIFSEKHRAFFKQELGESFRFKVAFQKWLKSNPGKTYREAVLMYPDIAVKKPEKLMRNLNTILISVISL